MSRENEVSRSSAGPGDNTPYVPSWCYDPPGPRVCTCGCHEGFHNDAGVCLQRAKCRCIVFTQSKERTP